MRIAYIDIQNFRGIRASRIYFNGHNVIIGDNNAGKSTIFEAIDLVLGPDRLSRLPIIDEHDFYNGHYYKEGENPVELKVEVLLVNLQDEQKRKFNAYLEFWNDVTQQLAEPGSIDEIGEENWTEALRVQFIGKYDPDDDDFSGKTYFCSPEREDGVFSDFSKRDKRECGFLYLRALRTGSRALSMERGSLLDIILRIKELRPQMWESVLTELRSIPVAAEEDLGISEVLSQVQLALKEFVPADWGDAPVLKVSDLTREHLRKTLTVFLSTGRDGYHAPFHHQGTGTVNTMVLALLSMIAEAKKTVIFAMEEPEIAIPPYTQKRIIHHIRQKSTQALFTSHSPFVLEEFDPEQIILVTRNYDGRQKGCTVSYPKQIKRKNYSSALRSKFAEALLARRVLIAEGYTEAIAYPAAARRLGEISPNKFNSLEGMGIAVFNAESDSSIAIYGEFFRKLGKVVFAIYDKQSSDSSAKIRVNVDYPYEITYKGIERLILEETDSEILLKYYKELVEDKIWPTHIKLAESEENEHIKESLMAFLTHQKAARSSAELIALCISENQIPQTMREILLDIKANTEKIN